MIALLSSRRSLALLLTGILVGAGCSSKAQFTSLHPAEADVGGLRKLAVCQFDGASGTGESATSSILSSLDEYDYYVLASTQELKNVAPAPIYDEQGRLNKHVALESARRLGADLLLVGDVKLRNTEAIDLGGAKLRFGESEVTIGVGFELVNVHDGRVLLADRVTATAKDESDKEIGGGPKAEKKKFNRLASEAAVKVAQRIAPHSQPVEVRLASRVTNGAMRKGNALASEGDWDQAIEQWRAALNEDPANHAAMYNIGLACEAMNDFGQAAHMYGAALEHEDNDLYREAAERVLKSGESFQLANAQIRQGPRRYPIPAHPRDRARQVAGPAPQGHHAMPASHQGPLPTGQYQRGPHHYGPPLQTNPYQQMTPHFQATNHKYSPSPTNTPIFR